MPALGWMLWHLEGMFIILQDSSEIRSKNTSSNLLLNSLVFLLSFWQHCCGFIWISLLFVFPVAVKKVCVPCRIWVIPGIAVIFIPLENYFQYWLEILVELLQGGQEAGGVRQKLGFILTNCCWPFLTCFPSSPTERAWLWLVTCKAELWLSGCVINSSGCQSENESSSPKIKPRALIISLEQINAFALIPMEWGQLTAFPDAALCIGFFFKKLFVVCIFWKP